MNDIPTEIRGLREYPLARRFMMTGLISGFTLATTRVEAQEIHTDSTGIVAGEVKIPVTDGALPGYAARPDGNGPFPVVIVNEEIFGVHEYIKDICRRLAKLGYAAVAPEIYARIADLSKYTDSAQIFHDVVSKAPDTQVMSDLDATVKFAENSEHGDPARLGVIGFCRGGRTTWLYAEHNPALKAAVAFYGPVAGPTSPIQPSNPVDLASGLKCPLLGLYGGQDPSISQADVRRAADAAKSAGQAVEIVVYPDAPHGFHADYRPSYKAADAADGWNRAIAWFKRYGVG